MTTSIPRRLARLFLALGLGLALAAPTAHAGKTDEAKAHVARASKAHKEGRFDEARVELEAAYALDPNPDLLYALGQVHAKLGHCQEATAYFQRFVATQKDPQVAKVVDQAIAACRTVPVADASAPRPGESPPSPPAPQPAQPFARSRAAPPAVAPPERSPWYRDKLGDGLVLGGVVAAIVGAIEYRSALSDLDAAEQRSSTTTIARYRDLIDGAHTKRTAALVLAGAGGALITAGIVRYVLRDRGTEVRSVGVAPARGGGVVTYEGRF